ncbi:MAG: hypothetical protein PHQ10_06690 [Dehalococcoidales bacterium]|jgi:cytochrome c553|nr:hypothetical protein [Dehalococcoidales bacterium]MDD5122565.1 hypothetical protein [Dehalococcoidales bacterium]
MNNKTKKATFNLHPTVLSDLEKAMAEGAATSKNALVERALIKELEELKRKKREAQWQQAARDSLFMNDIAEIEADFKEPDAETAERLDS